ncbi:MAG: DUF4838 domain-containing protein [Spirochaetes bacterium]|nr:DUF4838 domain-containing protein [Spirochaetota bacterium]
MAKSILVWCCVLAAWPLLAWGQEGVFQARPADRVSKNHRGAYDHAHPLTLAENGVFKAVILVPEDATPVARYAASELKSALDRIVGDRIPIVSAPVPGVVQISIGLQSHSRRLAPGADAWPRDAFVIRHAKEAGEVIVIAGRDDQTKDPAALLNRWWFWGWYYDKATLFAVREFLERFCGAGFYFPDEAGRPLPRARTLRVPSMEVYEAPDFEERTWNYGYDSFVTLDRKMAFHGTNQAAWANLERDFYRHQNLSIPACHGFRQFGLNQRFAQSHPEYFSLLPNGQRDLETGECKGHLCLSSRELEDIIFEDTLSYFKGEPADKRGVFDTYNKKTPAWAPSTFQPGYVNLMPEDGFGAANFCRCPACAPAFAADGNYSEYVFGFVGRIARRLKEAGAVGKVTTMAYNGYTAIPKIDLPDNLVVKVATPGAWNEKFPEVQKQQDELIRAWNRKLGGERAVTLWTYMNDFGGKIPVGVPALSPRAIVSYFNRIGPSVRGAFVESEISERFYNYLNWYVFGKVAWDNAVDGEALLAEHHARLFGPAAAPMAKAYDRLEALWRRCLGGYQSTTAGPVLMTPPESEIWAEIFSASALAEMRGLVAQGEAAASGDPAALSRVRYVGSNLFGAVERYRSDFQRRKREPEDLVVPAFAVADLKMKIDGALDEAAWGAAEVYSLVPLKRGEDPLALTRVRSVWSATTLYLAFECLEERPDEMFAIARPPDDPEIWKDNSVEVFLRPPGEAKPYFQFVVNSAGAFMDGRFDAPKVADRTWNSGMRLAAQKTREGWAAELAIPFASMGLKGGGELVANFCRSRILKDHRGDQLQTLTPFLVNGFHEWERFGRLQLVKDREAIPSDGSLLKNGSFEEGEEEGASEWTLPAKVGAVVANTFRHGSRCLRLSAPDFFEGKSVFASQSLGTLKPNTRYLISYFVRTDKLEPKPGAQYGGGFVNLWGAPGNVWFPPNAYEPARSYSGTRPWAKESYVFKTGEKPTPATVRIGLHPAKGTMWIDDLRLRELPPE